MITNDEYLAKLDNEMDGHTYFYIKLDSNDEYIVAYYAYYEAFVEFTDGTYDDIPSYAYKVLQVINNKEDGYIKNEIIEVNIYNPIIAITEVNGEDYLDDPKEKHILSIKRKLGIDEDKLYSLANNEILHADIPNLTYDGEYGIPIITNKLGEMPERLIPYTKINLDKNKSEHYIHFYKFDENFDGKYGVWNTIKYNLINKRGFSLDRIKAYKGVITPDYSLYGDMPIALQIHNIYRSRAVGAYLESKGLNVIPNVRWGNEETYGFAFAGLDSCEVIAVSTFGCSKTNQDKEYFLNGFRELISTMKFKMIIIYGSIFKGLDELLKEYNINYTLYPSEAFEAFNK